MAQTSDINSIDQNNTENSDIIQLEADSAGNINIPEGLSIGNADLSRDGQDLVLEFSENEGFSVENYFSNPEDTLIQDSSGSVLTEGLTNSFIQSSPEYAQKASMTDESPVGAVEEVKGQATVTHLDGSTEDVTLGTPIFQGDVIQTSGDGAVNIMFIDETSMGISEDARIAIDNYQFDPATESGETNLSVLRGVFVYTSGLIGRDDPDDVEIDTPVGSIGIRGTIIAGHINPEGESEISVLEGAIVVKNGAGERTLSQQYETVKLSSFQEAIEYKGVEAANDIGKTYGSVSDVLPKLFSSINDAKQEEVQAEEAEQEAKEEIESTEEEVIEATEEAETNETIDDQTLEMSEDGVGVEMPEGMKPFSINTDAENKENTQALQHPTAKPTGYVEDPAYQEAKDFTEAPRVIKHFKPVFENAESSDVIGVITLKNYPIDAVVDFVSTPTNYTIAQIAGTNRFEISLNSSVAGTAIGTSIELANLKVVFASGHEIDIGNFDPHVQDAAVNVNTTGGLDYHVTNGITPPNTIKLGDFNNDGTNDFAHINPTTNTVTVNGAPYAGSSVDLVGDINNDGHIDVIIGNPQALGSADIYDTTGLVQSNVGTLTADQYGHSVAGIGDFDGDGKSDYIIGAPGIDNGGTDRGKAYIKLGNGSDQHIATNTDGAELGTHVDGIGDINGDGLSDILVSGVGTQQEAYVVFGGSGNINDINTSTASTNALKILSTGQDIVSGGTAGDINGDGFDDFAISLRDGTAINTYVVYGHDGAHNNTNLDLAYLENPDNALKVHHAGAGANYSVTALGDVNGDGFDDIQVGDNNQQFVVRGDIGGDNVPYAVDGTATDGDGIDGRLAATAHNQSLVGDVDFNDANKTDLRMTGGNGNNTFEINNNDFSRIDGGKGFDTIKLVEALDTLDFSNINFEQIQQIESLEFGNTSQAITLTAENIFNMLKSSDNGELHIKGTGNLYLDDLDGSASSGTGIENQIREVLDEGGDGIASDLGAGHYQIGGYDLYIDATVNVNIV